MSGDISVVGLLLAMKVKSRLSMAKMKRLLICQITYLETVLCSVPIRSPVGNPANPKWRK